MKLILCRDCDDVRKIGSERTECLCGKSWGMYLDDVNAIYGGRAIPMGLDNHGLLAAVRGRHAHPARGTLFDAFVIETDCPTYRQGKAPKKKPSDEWYRKKAKSVFEKEGTLEIDPRAPVSRGDDPGAYVQAWVWVYDEDAQ